MPLNPATIAALAARLEKRLGAQVYATWLAGGVFAEGINDQSLTLKVGTQFVATYVRQHYENIITEEAAAAFGQTVKLSIAVDPFATGHERAGAGSIGGNAVPPAEIFRPVVPGGLDQQPDFFIPDVSEVPLKDDVSLMQVTPFTIQARGETRTRLVYELKNNQTITVAANPEHGLPTAFDYDIVLMMQSTLNGWANLYRTALETYEAEKKKGRDVKPPALPPRYFEPTAGEIMKFMRAERGGNTVDRLRASLNRLANTRIELEAKHPKKRSIRIGSFPLIDSMDITAETDTGQIQQVRIGIPNWVYDGIVERKTPTVLTYSREYLRLRQPFLRAIYRLLRPRLPIDGSQCAVPTKELHHLVASRQSLKEFHRELNATITKVREAGGYLGIMLAIEGDRATRRLVAWKVQDAPALPLESATESQV